MDDQNTLKVLIVVDVQNCFMFNDDKSNNFLNLGGTKDKYHSKDIAREIAELTKSNDLVVFTRDFHPVNHISFEKDEGRALAPPTTWPHHCRNKQRICKDRKNKNFTKFNYPSKNKKLIEDIPGFTPDSSIPADIQYDIRKSHINGTDLSYFLYETDIGVIVYNLNTQNKRGHYKIGLKSTQNEIHEKQEVDAASDENKLEDIHYQVEPYDGKYITLTKGERCNQESYSAFNYHIQYTVANPAAPIIDDSFESLKEKNSTGLWEWILNQKTPETKKIEITVCGLVGNVCVMHTILQGHGLWEEIYKVNNPGIEVEFIFSLKGTRFTPSLAPEKINPANVDKNESFIEWFNENDPLKNPNTINKIKFVEANNGKVGGKLRRRKTKKNKKHRKIKKHRKTHKRRSTKRR